MAQRQQLGKLTAPDASGLLAREHLFQRLDAARLGKLAWVGAPAGAGKTSLLASWLRARQVPAIWYQLDADDHDLATFFHYLSQAARQTGRQRLPVTSPENLIAPEAFARRYFARLFQGWETPQIWVLDNYHTLRDEAPLHRMIDIALDLLPQGSLIVVASRHEAPAPLRRHFAYASTAMIGWEDLRLSEAESAELGRLWGVAADVAAEFHAISDGWAAVQVLLMRLPSWQPKSAPPASDGLLFEYLSSEVYETLDPDWQAFLVKVALPPFVTPALAEQLGGRADAKAILSRLARERFLTTQHGQSGMARYQFHPLFRDFLLSRLSRDFPAGTVRRLKQQAAQALEQSGESEAAAVLLAEAEDWPGLARLLCSQAPAWLAQGRIATLRHWLECMPETARRAEPWLRYWHGTILRPFDPRLARAQLEPAWQQFKARGDAAGAYLTWAAILESYSAPWDEYRQIPAWLVELEQLRQAHPDIPSAEIEAQIVGTAKTVAMGAPFSPLLKHWVARAEALVVDAPSPRHIGPLALFISFNGAWRSESMVRLKTLLGTVKLPEDFAEKYPLSHIFYCMGLALLEAYDLNPDGCRQWVAKGSASAMASGIHLMDAMLTKITVHAHALTGDTANGVRALAETERLLNPAWKAEVVYLGYLRAGLKLMAGDTAAALHATDGLVESADALGARFATAFPRLLRALTLAIAGQGEAARAYLPEILELGRRFPCPWMEFEGELVAAHTWFAEGEEARGLAALGRAMAVGRRADLRITRFWLPEFIGPLCARALEAGIEADYVRRLIRCRGLSPTSPALDAWPWPVRIYTLGRFAVLLDDQPIAFSGKAQKRPLQLLKALIAYGGRGVSGASLAEALWEDESADARHALDMTLSRLRKLLGHDDAILIQDGKLSLNDKLCWLDSCSFERLASEAEKSDIAGAMALFERAMAHYTGPLLEGEAEAGWLLPRRERLRSRYVRLVLGYGDHLEQKEDWPAAIANYRRALEIEPLAEEIVQRLMAAHLVRGEHSQALEVFRRCRELLSIVLGVGPDRRTLALAEQARH